MRIKTVSTEIYTFAELGLAARDTAICALSKINLDCDWWQPIYEDAEQCGVKILSFDLDRNRHCKAKIEDTDWTANAIIADHGKECCTYKLAQDYRDAKADILANAELANAELDNDGDYVYESYIEDALVILAEDFIEDICEEYAVMLQRYYEYLSTEDAIVSTIDANDYVYEFTYDGQLI